MGNFCRVTIVVNRDLNWRRGMWLMLNWVCVSENSPSMTTSNKQMAWCVSLLGVILRAAQAQRESGLKFSPGKSKSSSRWSLGCVARSSYNRNG